MRYLPEIYIYILYRIIKSDKNKNFPKIENFNFLPYNVLPNYKTAFAILYLAKTIGLKFKEIKFEEPQKHFDDGAGLEVECEITQHEANKDINYSNDINYLLSEDNAEKIYDCTNLDFLKNCLSQIRKEEPKKWLYEYVLKDRAWQDKYFSSFLSQVIRYVNFDLNTKDNITSVPLKTD